MLKKGFVYPLSPEWMKGFQPNLHRLIIGRRKRTDQILVTLPSFKVTVCQRMLKNALSLSYFLKGLIDNG